MWIEINISYLISRSCIFLHGVGGIVFITLAAIVIVTGILLSPFDWAHVTVTSLNAVQSSLVIKVCLISSDLPIRSIHLFKISSFVAPRTDLLNFNKIQYEPIVFGIFCNSYVWSIHSKIYLSCQIVHLDIMVSKNGSLIFLILL